MTTEYTPPDIFSVLDFDKFASQVTYDMRVSIANWLRGAPTDEPALMSQISSNIFRKRRKCDIGYGPKFEMEFKLYELHRKGKHQTDKFGSDLALTINIETPKRFQKTAFFQFKVATDDKAKIEKRQIDDAKVIQEIYDRSFIFCSDKKSGITRVNEINKVDFKPEKDSTTLDIKKWEFFLVWLHRWLKCDLGKYSDPDAADNVENLLRSYVKFCKTFTDQEGDQVFQENDESQSVDFPISLTKSWIEIKVTLVEEKNSA